jgi:hypothetical protein
MTLPASSKGGGMTMTTGPIDVCKTPSPAGPVPIPYPNIGQCAQASKTCSKVKICGSEAITAKSEIPMSNGDNAGVAGGMKSSSFMQKVSYGAGNEATKVKMKGKKAARLTSMVKPNKGNTIGMQIVPSQVKVLVT